MKKIKIKIGELFRKLNLDNDYYGQEQTIEHDILIKDKKGSLTPINAFVKKDKLPMVEIITESQKKVTCSLKHIFMDQDENEVFAEDANVILTKDGAEKIISKTNVGEFYAYDISVNEPHYYQDMQGIIHHNTTCARILAHAISRDVLFINASDESGVDIVRNKIVPFCTTMSAGNMFDDDEEKGDLKVVILDEMEMSSERFQTALRAVIEDFYKTTRFIMTCNFFNKVIDPIKSRTQEFKFGDIEQMTILKRCFTILDNEGVKYDKKNVADVLKNLGTDIRRIIGTLQKLTITKEDGTKVLSKYTSLEERQEHVLQLITTQKLTEFRKYYNENNMNADELVKFLYKKAFEKKLGDRWVEIIAELAECAYRLKLGVDPEITLMNGVLQIMQLL
jgi:DNA polymerase III delta prime subunit